MKPLSFLDALFLYAETAETPMHLTSVLPLALPGTRRRDFVKAVRAHVARRLHLAPILHRKVGWAPLDLLAPVWVVDENIDLDHHVRRVELPAPGSMKDLSALVGRLQSLPLDRDRPLWELLLAEGFLGHGWVAILRVHHAGIDGQSGQVLLEALMDVSPKPRRVKAPPKSRPRVGTSGEAGAPERLARGLAHALFTTGRLASRAPGSLRTLKDLAGVMSPMLPALPPFLNGKDRAQPSAGVPRTLFNTPLTAERVWAARSIPLAQVQRIAKSNRATVNDVLLAVSGVALRAYLQERGGLPDLSLMALMPVSTRSPGDREMSNRVVVAPVRLHTDRSGPREQLRQIRDETAAVKKALSRTRGGSPTDFPSLGVPWITSGLVRLMGRFRLSDVLPLMGNLVITNVMTSTVPLYLCGARVVSYLPVLILMHGQALGIAIHTYAGSIDIGVVGCPRGMKDVERIGTLMVEAADQLDPPVSRRTHRPNPRPSRRAAPRTLPA